MNININQQNLNKQSGRDDNVNTRVNFSFKIPERKDKRILKEGTVKATSAKSIFGPRINTITQTPDSINVKPPRSQTGNIISRPTGIPYVYADKNLDDENVLKTTVKTTTTTETSTSRRNNPLFPARFPFRRPHPFIVTRPSYTTASVVPATAPSTTSRASTTTSTTSRSIGINTSRTSARESGLNSGGN